MHRREFLTTAANPDARHDYLVELHGEPAPGIRLTLRYVPDRAVGTPDGVAAYLGALFDTAAAAGPEALAVAVLDDLNNELIPRWVEITVERSLPVPHRVVIEDRQPGWDNPHLFSRMRRV
ncbi:hypothetical protein FBZ83_101621 [Azospirillum brasilense]|uniref:Uncharacterized protein n=1 Tax=Azospirillum brasilense TaxID=192 RepID=A0A560CSC4_AZOBR|nr:hypothetical protein [Azospirillum brasilense]TWA87755.1 hypothetical protein FBZ83_101621 [Azospirillum brasilense]